MKKLLHIIAQRPEKTGSGIYLQAILREADKKNYEQAFVAALNYGEEFIFESNNKIDFYPVFFHSENLPYNIVGMSDNMPYESTRYSEFTGEMLIKWKKAFREVITKAVDEFRPDIIISHHLWILTAYVKELFPHIKVFGVCHGTDLRQLRLAPKFSDYVKRGCAKLDLVLSLNEYQKDKIIDEFGVESERIKIIGSGYNSYIFHRVKRKVDLESIDLVYAGKLTLSKGVLSLIRSVDKINYYNKKIRITIVGTGSGEETEAIYNEAKLCKHEVNFTGAVSQDKLAKIFRESDIFILPSFYEGLPLVLIEALASGLKVVTTDLPGVKPWIGKKLNSSGIIEYVKLPEMEKIDVPFKEELPDFEDRLRNSIEAHINRLLEHKNICEDWVYEDIKKLSWFGVFETVENILDKAIE